MIKNKAIISITLLWVMILSPITALARNNPVFNDSSDIVKGVPAFYDDSLYPQQSERLLSEVKKAKGQRIGIGNKGAIALRFDDWQNAFKKKIQPELKKRELPASMALIAGFQDIYWGKQATWKDVRKWNRQGLEIWSHGIDHQDYADFKGLVHNVVGSKQIMEAHGLKVQGFVLPGVWKYYNPRPYGLLVSSGDYDQIPGRLIQQTYALSEAYVWNSRRRLPETNYHGADHLTISDGLFTYDEIIALIDDVIENKSGLELMIHSGNLGKPDKLSLKEFLRILDYIQLKRETGALEVLTPSGLMFADHTGHRLKLLDLKFDEPYSPSPAYDAERVSDEGGGRAPTLTIPSGGSSRAQFTLDGLIPRQAAGESFEVLVQCTDPTASLALKALDPKRNLISQTITSALDGDGIKRMVFIIPPGLDQVLLSVTSGSSDPVELLWVKVQKI